MLCRAVFRPEGSNEEEGFCSRALPDYSTCGWWWKNAARFRCVISTGCSGLLSCSAANACATLRLVVTESWVSCLHVHTRSTDIAPPPWPRCSNGMHLSPPSRPHPPHHTPSRPADPTTSLHAQRPFALTRGEDKRTNCRSLWALHSSPVRGADLRVAKRRNNFLVLATMPCAGRLHHV